MTKLDKAIYYLQDHIRDLNKSQSDDDFGEEIKLFILIQILDQLIDISNEDSTNNK